MCGELEKQKNSRKERENAIEDMLKDIIKRVGDELLVEKEEREQTEEKILLLLEDTCSKLNLASQQL